MPQTACHDEHSSHSHDSHNHSHSNHDSHDHSHDDDQTPALQNHIYAQIDFAGIRTLNESVAGSGRAVVEKTWAGRMETAPEVESDADEQVILHVPFTAQIRLQTLFILSSPSPSAPLTLHLHANNPTLDFSASSTPPTQTFHLSQTSQLQEIPVKRALFASCSSVALFFEDNHGHGEEEVTRVSYVGFGGEWMRLGREPVSVLYEAVARPSDHKVEGVLGYGMGSGLGSGRRGF